MSEYKAAPFEWLTETDNFVGLVFGVIAGVAALLNGSAWDDALVVGAWWAIGSKLVVWEVLRQKHRRAEKRAARQRFIDAWAEEKPRFGR